MAKPRKRILCIEDDRETAALIAEELLDRGYDVIVAHDGREGFAAILKSQPDLVLSDISMPAMSGFELLERLVALDREKNLLTRDIVILDLRLPDRITVRLTDAAAAARIEALKDKPKKKANDA